MPLGARIASLLRLLKSPGYLIIALGIALYILALIIVLLGYLGVFPFTISMGAAPARIR